MKSPAAIIRELLIDQDLAEESGDWRAFISFLPDQPNNAICVYDTAGTPDGRMMGTGERIQHLGIQIRVRGENYSVTWDKVEAIVEALDAAGGSVVAFDSAEAYLVHNVSRTGTVMPLGVEEQGSRRLHNFTINAITTLFETDDAATPYNTADWRPYWVQNE